MRQFSFHSFSSSSSSSCTDSSSFSSPKVLSGCDTSRAWFSQPDITFLEESSQIDAFDAGCWRPPTSMICVCKYLHQVRVIRRRWRRRRRKTCSQVIKLWLSRSIDPFSTGGNAGEVWAMLGFLVTTDSKKKFKIHKKIWKHRCWSTIFCN